MMRREAAEALEKLFRAAEEEEHYTLVAVSGYRSYQTQRNIYKRRIKNAGQKKADKFVALPGASEHQLGLAMDVGRRTNHKLKAAFGNTPEGKWLAEHCHEYGYIIRYPKDKTHITGYVYEPWHIRYVGKEAAAEIAALDVTFEEYILMVRRKRITYLEGGTGSDESEK